jgi:hypothetical protein
MDSTSAPSTAVRTMTLTGAGNLDAWRKCMETAVKHCHPATSRLIFVDITPPTNAILAIRQHDTESHMSEVDLLVPAPLAPPTTPDEAQAFKDAAPIYESLSKRKDAAMKTATGAIMMIMSNIDPVVVENLRACVPFATALADSNVAELWKSIPLGLEPRGAAGIFGKSEAYVSYISIKQNDDETLAQYHERFRATRSKAISLGNPDQREIDLAHRYMNSLNESYAHFRNNAAQREVPVANLIDAMIAAGAWTIAKRDDQPQLGASAVISATASTAPNTRTVMQQALKVSPKVEPSWKMSRRRTIGDRLE